MSSNVLQNDKQNLAYIVRSGIAGGVAGCVAKTVVAPLDRVKILFQASNPDFRAYAGTWSGAVRAGVMIYRDNGVFGLFQGHSATLLRIFPYAAIKYMVYDQIEHILMPTREKRTPLKHFVSGALAGTISVFFTYPLDLIRVRMAYHTRSITNGSKAPSFLHTASEIYRETPRASTLEPTNIFHRLPMLKFYRGFTVTITGMVPYAGTSFLVWGGLRNYFLPPSSTVSGAKQKPTPLADLTIGAIAGTMAQTVSYPFEVIRRRMQVGGLTHPDRWMRWRETVGTIWSSGGWKGFYVGLSIGYVKIVPMTAVSFAVWQWGKRLLDV